MRIQFNSTHMRRPGAVIAAAVVAGGMLTAPVQHSAAAVGDVEEVSGWIEGHAVPIRDLDGRGPDLAQLGQVTRQATIVGLGEQGHRLAEITALKRRALEYLIEKRGFGSLAWEGDWTLGTMINDYIHDRRDDVESLVAQMSIGGSREVVDLLDWLREYNRTHDDQVSFVGVEYFATRHLAYDEVKAYVADRAPRRLPGVNRLYERIYPCEWDTTSFCDDIGDHLEWYYQNVENKAPYVKAVRRLHELVASVPHQPGDRRHSIVLHHARQIRSWYTAFALPRGEIPDFRDARAAENLRWWQQFTGDKVAYWAQSVHTADATDVVITAPPPQPGLSFASVGSYLDGWYGDGYVTVGYTFDSGTMLSDRGEPVPLPPAADDWFSAPLADVDMPQFLIRLDRPMPDTVRDWLHAPMLDRGHPLLGHASTASGSTPADWYDIIVHRQVVSPVTPLQTSQRW